MKKWTLILMLVMATFVSAEGEWYVVMGKDPEATQNQVWVRGSWDDVVEAAQEYFAENKRVLGIVYGEGGWTAVLAEGTVFEEQILVSGDLDFLEKQLDAEFGDYIITDLRYGEGSWGMVLSKLGVDVDIPQTFIRGDWEYVHKQLSETEDLITSLSYGEESWVAVATEIEGDFEQTYYWGDYASILAAAEAEAENGNAITSLTYGEDAFVIVATANTGVNNQIWASGSWDEVAAFIEENWAENEIQDLVYVNYDE